MCKCHKPKAIIAAFLNDPTFKCQLAAALPKHSSHRLKTASVLPIPVQKQVDQSRQATLSPKTQAVEKTDLAPI